MSGFVRFCPVRPNLEGERILQSQPDPLGGRGLPGKGRMGTWWWIRLSIIGAGLSSIPKGFGVGLEARTQFSRRLIIGSGGAKTNDGWPDRSLIAK
jgi:hypothetical protein